MEGGAKKEFHVGERVFLRGVTDGYASRPWEISKIGHKFITVIALDPTGLTADKQIRIVMEKDIYRSNEMVHSGIQSIGMPEATPLPMMNPVTSMAPPVQITFAPKIFNHGNDNSIEVEPANQDMNPSIPSALSEMPMASILGTINESTPPLIKIRPEIVKESSSEEVLDLSKPFSITKKG
jgi:hypothetical protein